MRDMKALDCELARLAVNRYISDRADIGTNELVFDVGEAASGHNIGIAIGLRALAPFAKSGQTLQQLFAAAIREIF